MAVAEGDFGRPIVRQVVEDRAEQIDRHDHVDVAGRALLAALLQLQRADADQLTARPDQQVQCRPSSDGMAR